MGDLQNKHLGGVDFLVETVLAAGLAIRSGRLVLGGGGLEGLFFKPTPMAMANPATTGTAINIINGKKSTLSTPLTVKYLMLLVASLYVPSPLQEAVKFQTPSRSGWKV